MLKLVKYLFSTFVVYVMYLLKGRVPLPTVRYLCYRTAEYSILTQYSSGIVPLVQYPEYSIFGPILLEYSTSVVPDPNYIIPVYLCTIEYWLVPTVPFYHILVRTNTKCLRQHFPVSHCNSVQCTSNAPNICTDIFLQYRYLCGTHFTGNTCKGTFGPDLEKTNIP